MIPLKYRAIRQSNFYKKKKKQYNNNSLCVNIFFIVIGILIGNILYDLFGSYIFDYIKEVKDSFIFDYKFETRQDNCCQITIFWIYNSLPNWDNYDFYIKYKEFDDNLCSTINFTNTYGYTLYYKVPVPFKRWIFSNRTWENSDRTCSDLF
jgi:hypothetical protein